MKVPWCVCFIGCLLVGCFRHVPSPPKPSTGETASNSITAKRSAKSILTDKLEDLAVSSYSGHNGISDFVSQIEDKDVPMLKEMWASPDSTEDQKNGIAATMYVRTYGKPESDAWYGRPLLPYTKIAPAPTMENLTGLPLVLGEVYLATGSSKVLDSLINMQLDGGPAENQGNALIRIFLEQPERLDALFAPNETRLSAETMRWFVKVDLEDPNSETAKALIALRDRRALPNFQAFMSRLEATQKQADQGRKLR